MGLLKPNQLSPLNTTIDATDINRFSWVTNGAKQTAYRVYIYNNDTNALLYDSASITSPNNYHDLAAATLTNGLNCKWYVTTIAGISSQSSEYEFFMTNDIPVTEFTAPVFGDIIESIEITSSTTGWVTTGGTATTNLITYLADYATSSISLVSSGASVVSTTKTSVYDLTQFENGLVSTTADLIQVVINIPSLTNIGTVGVVIQFANGVNSYTYNWIKSTLVAGWNYLSIAKSSFTGSGSPDWASMTTCKFQFYADATATVYIQAVDLVQGDTPDNTTITTQDYNFVLSYVQDQDVNLKAYKFILSDSDGVEITDTDWIYDFALEYEFTGFENDTTYQIEAKVISQNDQEGSTGVKTFDVLYINNQALPDFRVTAYDDDGYNLVDWSNIQYRDATYSGTASYVTGKFGDEGLDVEAVETLDMGSLTVGAETEYTLTAWVQFIIGLSGNFLQLDTSVYIGYDDTNIRFYYTDGTTYIYSVPLDLSELTGGYVFIGLTPNYFIIKKDNILRIAIDISSIDNPSPINNVRFIGNIYLDNVHGQVQTLTNTELLAEDYRYLFSATPTLLSTSDVVNAKLSLKISSTRNIAYETNGNTGLLKIYDNSGTLYDTESFNSENAVIGSMVELSSNLFMLAYQDSTSSSAKVKMFYIESDAISIWDTQEFWSNSISEVNLVKLDNGYIMAAFRDDITSKGLLEIIEYSGFDIITNELNTTYLNSENDVSTISLVAVDSTTAVLYYYDEVGNDNKNTIVTRNNIQASIGTIFDIGENAEQRYFGDAILLDSTHVLYSYYTAYSPAGLYLGITEISGDYLVNEYTKLIMTSSTQITLWHLSYNDLGYYIASASLNASTEAQIVSITNSYKIQTEDTIEIYSSYVDYLSSNNAGTNELFVLYGRAGIERGQILVTDFEVSSTTTDKEALWINYYSRFLANFESSLSSGNFSSYIGGFRLKRLASDGSLYQTIDDFEVSDLTYKDLTPRNAVTYTYALYALDVNGNEDLGTTATGVLDFYGWFLTDGTNIYKFDIENSSDSIKSNIDMKTYDNYTTYPTISFGNRNYRDSGIKTIPYSYNSTSFEYSFSLSLLDELRAFINNGLVKYLKNTKGEIFKIVTYGFSYNYNDNIPDQIYEVSFNWTEVGIGEVT